MAGYEVASDINLQDWFPDLGVNGSIESLMKGYNGSVESLNTSEDLFCYRLHKASENMLFAQKTNAFTSLTFVAVGLVGNFFSFLVFSSKDMRSISSNVYLLLLACSDSFYLISVLFAKILSVLRCLYFTSSAIDPYNSSVVWCSIFQFILDLCANYSTSLILAFTMERFIAIYLPIRFKELCTVRRARLICLLSLLIIAILVAPHHFLSMAVSKNLCFIEREHEKLFGHIYVAEMVIFRIMPVIIIAIINIFIIVKLSLVNRQKRRLKNNSRTPACTCAGEGRKKTKSKRRPSDERNLQITVMLIMVSTSYIIVFLPVMIVFIIYAFTDVPDAIAEILHIAKLYTGTLYVLGFAINFFLYTVSGRIFREQLMRILCERDIRQQNQKSSANNGQTCISQCPEATTLV